MYSVHTTIVNLGRGVWEGGGGEMRGRGCGARGRKRREGDLEGKQERGGREGMAFVRVATPHCHACKPK